MTSTLAVAAYVEAFEALRKVNEQSSPRAIGASAISDVLEDQLDELWLELSVDDVREVERRYPELRIRRYA